MGGGRQVDKGEHAGQTGCADKGKQVGRIGADKVADGADRVVDGRMNGQGRTVSVELPKV